MDRELGVICASGNSLFIPGIADGTMKKINFFRIICTKINRNDAESIRMR